MRLRELALATGVVMAAKLGSSLGCLGFLVFLIMFGPILVPLACLAWFGQPGPRWSERTSEGRPAD